MTTLFSASFGVCVCVCVCVETVETLRAVTGY